MSISDQDLEGLVQLYEQSSWRELELQLDDTYLYLGRGEAGRTLRRDGGATVASSVAVAATPATAPAPQTPVAAPSSGSTAPKASSNAEQTEFPEGCVPVRTPSLGNFYRSAKPGAAPYVEVGQRVEPGTEVCLIEVMKLFTTVQAGVAGVIKSVLVNDGALVEFGQPLFVIDTRG